MILQARLRTVWVRLPTHGTKRTINTCYRSIWQNAELMCRRCLFYSASAPTGRRGSIWRTARVSWDTHTHPDEGMSAHTMLTLERSWCFDWCSGAGRGHWRQQIFWVRRSFRLTTGSVLFNLCAQSVTATAEALTSEESVSCARGSARGSHLGASSSLRLIESTKLMLQVRLLLRGYER